MEILPKLSQAGIYGFNLFIALIGFVFIATAPVNKDQLFRKKVWSILMLSIFINYLSNFLLSIGIPNQIVIFGQMLFTTITGILFLNQYVFKLKLKLSIIISCVIGALPAIYLLFCIVLNLPFNTNNAFTVLNLLFVYIAFLGLGWEFRKVDIVSALVFIGYAHLQTLSPIIEIYNKYLRAGSDEINPNEIFIIGAAIKISMISSIYKILGVAHQSEE